ncbi:hypothetical protein OIU35_29130 [Boseaceae bacterium BT-24-1]|nr:hypothetical protein [Boseaceae bacterium BT-24-1]
MDCVEEDDFLQSDSKWWSTTIDVPYVSRLTDEEMEIHFAEFDGKWSPQTKQAVSQFRADGVDLNESWALTWYSWACRCCRRDKAQIFRLGPRNILHAKLEFHHDHMRDTVFKRAKELCGDEARWIELCRGRSIHILTDHIRELLLRFPRSLICSDCNAADGTAKARLGLPASFSFSPSEIAAFITIAPNKEHGIQTDKARAIWMQQEPAFKYRRRLLDQLIHDVLSGALALDRSAGAGKIAAETGFQPGDLLYKSFYARESSTQRVSLLRSVYDDFIARSVSRGAHRSAAGTKRKAATRAPTEAELEAYVDPVSSKLWSSTPSSWECPVCRRTKRSILRWSNSGKWSGSIRDYTTYQEERDRENIENRVRMFPSFFNERHIFSKMQVLICSDCADVKTRACQHDRSLVQPIFGLDDIEASIISSEAHHAHEVDLVVATARAHANDPLKDALSAFEAFGLMRERLGNRYDRLKEAGYEDQLVMADLVQRLCDDHDICDDVEAEYLVGWILDQPA